MIATAKHFLGYAMTEGGQNMAATQVTARELREVYARPFAAAIQLAGLASVMNSYSEIDGIPVGASEAILTGLLRDELGFEGTVVSDYTDRSRCCTPRQKVAQDCRGGRRAGADRRVSTSSCLRWSATARLPRRPGARRGGRRGHPRHRRCDGYCATSSPSDCSTGPTSTRTRSFWRTSPAQGVDLADRLAGESLTLLKNDDSDPAAVPEVRRIAIVGPHADEVGFAFPGYTYPVGLGMLGAMMCGGDGTMAGLDASVANAARGDGGRRCRVRAGLRGHARGLHPPALRHHQLCAEAIRELVPDAEVTVAPGCGVLDSEPHDIEAAVEAAAGADVVIAAFGGRGGWFFGATTEGEGSDSADIELPRNQRALLKAVAATGTPVVGVLSTGRPMALAESLPSLSALVHAYYGGQQGTRAIAEALFGITNPGGKLPYSMPRHTGQVPIYAGQHNGSGYRRTESDMHKGYRDLPATPLFAFGHGLSYTAFAYSDVTLSDSTVDSNGSIEVSVTVTNTGAVSGDEVVQLYFSDTATLLARPAQELVGFRRISLEPGEATTVTFTVQLDQLAYLDVDGTTYILEAGPVDVLVGTASDDIRARAAFDVVGPTVMLGRQRSFLSDSRVQ